MGTDKSGGKISNPLMQIEPLIHAMWSDTRYQHIHIIIMPLASIIPSTVMKRRYEKLLNGHYKSNALAFRASRQNSVNKTTKIAITI